MPWIRVRSSVPLVRWLSCGAHRVSSRRPHNSTHSPCQFLDRAVNAREESPMGGDEHRIGATDAASTLGWWLQAGVDVAIAEEPRNWLSTRSGSARVESPAKLVDQGVEED